jgi:hypothetical protein
MNPPSLVTGTGTVSLHVGEVSDAEAAGCLAGRAQDMDTGCTGCTMVSADQGCRGMFSPESSEADRKVCSLRSASKESFMCAHWSCTQHTHTHTHPW